MKVSMVCGKFQRKKQRGGILLREQRSASVCILLLQNSPLSLAPCNTFQPQGLVFSGHNGRCSRNGRWGLVTRNAVILGGDCGHKQSQTHLLSRPYVPSLSHLLEDQQLFWTPLTTRSPHPRHLANHALCKEQRTQDLTMATPRHAANTFKYNSPNGMRRLLLFCKIWFN